MVSQSEAWFHIQGLSRRMEEMRQKFGTSVRGDMRWNSMFREDMDDEKFGQLGRGDSIMSRNEESLLSETVYHYQNSSETFGVGELLNKVHKNWFPGTEWNRELTEKAIWFMSFCFWPSTGSARFNIICYKLLNIGPSILPLDDRKSFVDTKMSRDWIIMKTLKDMEPKISGFQNKNLLINLDESHIVYRPMRIFGVVGICMKRLYSWVSIISS
jgi:hypothetical protein